MNDEHTIRFNKLMKDIFKNPKMSKIERIQSIFSHLIYLHIISYNFIIFSKKQIDNMVNTLTLAYLDLWLCDDKKNSKTMNEYINQKVSNESSDIYESIRSRLRRFEKKLKMNMN